MRRVNGAMFKGRVLKVEPSEDLSREEKAARRAEKQSEEFRMWEETPPQLRAAPGFQPSARPPGGREEEFWPSRQHSNKMMRGGGTPGPAKPYHNQMPPVTTEFGGGYEKPKSRQDPLEVYKFISYTNIIIVHIQEVNVLLNDYHRIVNESTADSQV